MAKVKQLTVALENRPGTLAHMAKVLADAKVNIVALLNSTAGAQGSAQVVVDNVNRAKKALGAAGLPYTEGTLEQVELANKPGALAELAGKLAKKGTNIECAHTTMLRGRRRRSWCLRSPDPPCEDKTSNRVAHGTRRCSAALMNS